MFYFICFFLGTVSEFFVLIVTVLILYRFRRFLFDSRAEKAEETEQEKSKRMKEAYKVEAFNDMMNYNAELAYATTPEVKHESE